MKKNNTSELIEVFSGSTIEAEIVKSILNDTGIESFLKDEYMGTIAPWQTASGGLGAVKVIVSSLVYPQAKMVIEKYMNQK